MRSSTDKDLNIVAAGEGHVYRPAPSALINAVIVCFAALSLGASVGLAGFMGSAFSVEGGVAVASTLFVAASLVVGQALSAATVLYSDRIERRDLFVTRSMLRSDILGYRRRDVPNGAAIVRLTPRPTDLRPLTIRAYQRDAEFDRWFDGIANLDALDRAAAHARLLADPALGASPARREARLKLLRRLTQVFGLIAVGVAIWVFVWPRPAPWAVVAGLGLVPVMIGLVWLSGGRLVIGYDKAEPRPSVVLGLAAAPAVLLRTFQLPIHQWPLALGESAVAAVVVLAVVLLLDARWAVLRLPRWILALWLTVYGFGAVAFINRAADQTAPKTYHALVQRKSPPGLALGDWDLGGWDVGLGSWDDVGQPGAEFVTRAIYDKLAVGEYACVGLHPGALGVWWYDVQACSPTAKEPVTFSLVAEMPTADDMAYMYPDFAQRHNFEGHTRFRCTITATGGLTDCVILLEDPPGMGFGAATLRLASTFKMKTRMPDGSSTAGKVYISGVRWRLPRQ